MNKKLVILIILLLSFQTTIYAKDVKQNKHSQLDLNNLGSNRNTLPDAVIIPDSDPFFGIIGSYIACWYDKNNNSTGLLPLLVKHDEKLTSNQEIFLNQYLIDKEKKLLVLGEKLQTKYETVEILGSSPNVSISVATLIFTNVTTVLIVPYRTENAYQQSLIASPLASYLNIPILIFDNNTLEIINVCNSLNVSNAYIIGDVQLILPNITTTVLKTTEEIQNTIISIIKNQFNSFDYITLANPSDTIQYYLTSSNNTKFIDKIKNVKLTILGKEIDIIGTNVKQYNINIPGGINLVKIFGNITGKKTQILNLIKPVIYMFLYDPQGNIVAYSNSLAYETGKTYVETLTINASGNYLLILKLYNGIKGGYFSQRGFSQITTDIEISINISTLEKPHMPSIPNLSMLAPYLTSAHGGIILADPNFEITDENYTFIANGSGTSPCYNESLHDYTNQKVNYTIKQIKNILSILDNHSILNNYLNGPAWLAIIADTNMVPMYYYGPSQQGLLEKGLPSDNPYSLNFNLSVGRIIGWDVQDVSLLISRTFFYKDI
ncbi:MAG: cell wall-binding repeat-containing protein, partial [Candidatus Thermoplasmatota archaeon]|nr:cell wall-binding repeat-containing protein [Candidatus Thermoplasmatota archaeon]